MRELSFTPIDIQSWKRGQIFYCFSKMAPTGYSLTVTVDVTHIRKVLKEHGMKFFPAYLWTVTKLLSEQQEFRIAEKDRQLGEYNYLTPLYASFHDDDKTFPLMWTAFDDDLNAFCEAYMENQKKYGGNHGVLSQSEMLPPPNAYTVSCVP